MDDEAHREPEICRDVQRGPDQAEFGVTDVDGVGEAGAASDRARVCPVPRGGSQICPFCGSSTKTMAKQWRALGGGVIAREVQAFYGK